MAKEIPKIIITIEPNSGTTNDFVDEYNPPESTSTE
jgi:hypothetical protein